MLSSLLACACAPLCLRRPRLAEKALLGDARPQAPVRDPTRHVSSPRPPIRRTEPSPIAAESQHVVLPEPQLAYATELGAMYEGTAEAFLGSSVGQALRGEVQLVFTSPPFPLNRKKRYGNRVGDEYLAWLAALAEPLGDLLTEDGSLVVELGNAWEPGQPVMSTLALKALLRILEGGRFHLCQQFVVHNPARLPSPAQWVNVERIRVKDAYTT